MTVFDNVVGEVQLKFDTRQRERDERLSLEPNSSADFGMGRSLGPRKGVTVQLNLERLANLGMVTPDYTNDRIIEEYRYIKRPILTSAFDFSDTDPRANVLIVTSSLPGEGKTFNSINLAMSVAMEKNRRVLLVDGDLERAGLSRTLGISSRQGLGDFLARQGAVIDDWIIRVAGVERLSILPAGPTRRDAVELLSSDRMSKLIDELAVRYPDRLIIIDTPPLLSSASAGILSELAGQVILVVAAEETSGLSLEEALTKLPKDKSVRLILNKYQPDPGQDPYMYGYYRASQSKT